MKHFLACLLIAFPAMGMSSPVFAGQPNAECGEEGAETPPGKGMSANGPGSPFVDGVSSGVYANAGATPPGGNNSTKTLSHDVTLPVNATSQYDVACKRYRKSHFHSY